MKKKYKMFINVDDNGKIVGEIDYSRHTDALWQDTAEAFDKSVSSLSGYWYAVEVEVDDGE